MIREEDGRYSAILALVTSSIVFFPGLKGLSSTPVSIGVENECVVM